MNLAFNSMNNYNINVTNDPVGHYGCWLWLDASDTNTMIKNATSGALTQWNDKSTNRYAFTTSSTTTRPTFTLNSLNNRPAIAFSAANQQFLVGSSNNFEIGLNSFYLFIVFNFNETYPNTAYKNQSVFAKANNTTQLGEIAIYRGNGSAQLYMDIIDTPTANHGRFVMADTTFNLFTLICDRQNGSICVSAVFKNGYEISTNAKAYTEYNYTTGTNLPNLNKIFIGAFNSTSTSATVPLANSSLDGSIAEIIGYSMSKNMPNYILQKIEGYLSWKWGLQSKLPSTHIYKTNAPT